MKLNKASYIHKKTASLLHLLEEISGLQMITDIYSDFEEIRLVGRLSYIVIDYEKRTCFSLSHKITSEEFQIIDEIMIYLGWIDVGNRYQSQKEKKDKFCYKFVTKT